MKIADVVVGTEYGAHDSPTSRGYGADPRQVKVLEIVTEQKRVYGGHYLSGGSQKTRNVRRVKVEVLDGEKDKPKNTWRTDKIKYASKGDIITIEARQLVGVWKDLRSDILKRKTEEQARIAFEESVEDKLKGLGFKLGWGETRVHARDSKRIEVEFNDSEVTKLLKLLGV